MENSIARRAALVLLLSTTLFAQTRRLPPADESGRDQTLVAYLMTFKHAVAKHDRAALLALVHPDVKLGFGGDDGIGKFQPDWAVLQRLLNKGGAWQGTAFTIPYVFAKFPEDLDAFDYAAVTGSGVWLRAEASATSRGQRQLNYEIVQVKNSGDEWWEVTTLRGEHGYVSARYIHSPIGYRAMFQKNERGEWKLFALLEGD